MNIENAIESLAVVENAAGPHYLTFPYVSTVGNSTEQLTVRVPIHGEQPSPKDKIALAEAISVQGALGEWVLQANGEAWLVAKH
jgi:hypothetical protein